MLLRRIVRKFQDPRFSISFIAVLQLHLELLLNWCTHCKFQSILVECCAQERRYHLSTTDIEYKLECTTVFHTGIILSSNLSEKE